MALIGTAPPANRYDGIGVGPKLAYLFETQEGIPVDGTNASLRDFSPFTLRIIPPDVLVAQSAPPTDDVDLLTAAALGASTTSAGTSVATMLRTVMATGTTGNTTGQLESFVANGQFFTNADATFVSTLADAFSAADIALQLERILAAEPLVLLVNPNSMSVQRTKIQSYQSHTRYGIVFEAWGEDQVTISFSGSTGGFVAAGVDASSPYGAQVTGETASVSGYQEAARRDSAAWQNFQSLYHFYRNNGYIYDTIKKSYAHLFVGAVAIDYDQWTYVGHIESFSYRFDEAMPLRVEFDLEFKASKIYDRALSSTAVLPLLSSPSGVTSATGLSNGDAGVTTPTSVEYGQVPLDTFVRRL